MSGACIVGDCRRQDAGQLSRGRSVGDDLRCRGVCGQVTVLLLSGRWQAAWGASPVLRVCGMADK